MAVQLILDEAMADGLDIIGERWTLLILKQAFYGCRRFEDFRKATGASRATLTRRLKALVDSQILYKSRYGKSNTRFEYRFTEIGLSLLDASLLAARWESDWQINTDIKLSQQLYHRVCAQHMQPLACCRHCHQEIRHADIEWQDASENLPAQFALIRNSNSGHRKRRNDLDAGLDTKALPSTLDLANLIGDRWSILILISAFFGANKYDVFEKYLGIPPSVLSARLKLLVKADIFSRQAYQKNPTRYSYNLSEKGVDLFSFIMILRQWVKIHFGGDSGDDMLIHKNCGAALLIDVVCSECNQKPWPQDLIFSPE